MDSNQFGPMLNFSGGYSKFRSIGNLEIGAGVATRIVVIDVFELVAILDRVSAQKIERV